MRKKGSVVGLFLSTFVNKIDTKGRVSVPAPFRAAIAKESFPGVVLFRSYKTKALEGCGLSWMERLSQSLDTMDLFSEKQDQLAATVFADAHQLPFDGDGRIVLPPKLTDHGSLVDKVAFVGRGSTFQMWPPHIFEAHQNQARQSIVKSTLPLSLLGTQPSTHKQGEHKP